MRKKEQQEGIKPAGDASIEHIKALAQTEWERLKAALELKCHDFIVRRTSGQIELMAPGKKMTITFESADKRFPDESCVLEVATSKEVTQYFFRLSADKVVGHFFECQRLKDVPNHLIQALPKTTAEKIAAEAFRYLSR
jgi:hypothetical protein